MIQSESFLMRAFRKIGFEGLAWSLRRLHCPVPKDALVLEVGSGGKPYFRANVLLDAFEDGLHRYGSELVVDRPFVFGDMENLPFRDKVFDFVIASHVLEHSSYPDRFLKELERVARGGYIETPDAFVERINPYHFHKLEVTVRDERLCIRKKSAWVSDPALTELYEHYAKRFIAYELIPQRPFAFNVRYYWEGTIQYGILNPEVDADWPIVEKPAHESEQPCLKARINSAILRVINVLLSQRARNRRLDIVPLLRCPSCRADPLERRGDEIVCKGCGTAYAMPSNVPRMYVSG